MRKDVCIALLTLILACAGCKPSVTKSAPTEFEPAVFTGIKELPALNDWSHWRGPRGDGRGSDESIPTTWSETQNVVWKTELPGRGHSSPIVHGELVFLTTADEQTGAQSLLAFDRASGKQRWETTIHQQQLARAHAKNSHASATPACDGNQIYCAFLNASGLFVTATNLEGDIVWQKKVGDFDSEHGFGSSPVLYKSLVIVNGDNLTNSFVAALHTKDGELAWKTDRASTGQHGSYGTPLVAAVSGRPQLLVAGTRYTIAYNPETGKQLWICDGPAEVTGCTPAASDTLVFSSGGFPEKEIVAIRGDGEGDVTNSHVVWRARRGTTYVPSPIYHDGHLFVVNDEGVATCFDAKSGDTAWQQRLEGNFSGSPVITGEYLLVTNEEGVTFVLQAKPEFKLLARNRLPGGALSTPAISQGRLYLRTADALYCIGG